MGSVGVAGCLTRERAVPLLTAAGGGRASVCVDAGLAWWPDDVATGRSRSCRPSDIHLSLRRRPRDFCARQSSLFLTV